MLASSRSVVLLIFTFLGLSLVHASPCTSNSQCPGSMNCGTDGQCGGVGASCASNSYCMSPYPCQDNGYGYSYCQNYNAATGSSPAAKTQSSNYGLFTVCTASNGCGSYSCGSARSNSTEPGVCGGTQASCSLYSQCATGVCAPGTTSGPSGPGGSAPGGSAPGGSSSSGTCITWQNAVLAIGASCTYSQQCAGTLVCADDGTGTATCRASTSNRARVCEPGISDSCSSDPNYSTCGTARSGSSETGVCGGAGVSCSNNAACWSGTCNAMSRTCQYTATPQATTAISRRRLSNSACPAGKILCPIGSNGRNLDKISGSGYECTDISSNLESCGGCIHDETPFGHDCTTLDNVDDVACMDGKCKINSCLRGWLPAADHRSCIKINRDSTYSQTYDATVYSDYT